MSSLYLLLNAITSMGSHQEKPAYIACLCLHLRTFDYTLLGLVTRPYLWALLLGLTGPYWALLGLTGPHWALLGLTGPYWALLAFTLHVSN